MKIPIKRMMRSASVAFLLLLIFIVPAGADENPPDALPNLFSQADPVGPEERTTTPDPRQPEVIRQRTAEIDFSLLAQMGRSAPRPDQAAFTLNFFEDAQFEAFITHTEIFSNGAVGLVGRVDSEEFNELVMVSNQDVLQAYLQVGGQAFEIRATGSGHQIVEVDQSAYPDSLPPVTPPQPDEGNLVEAAAVEPDQIAAADSGAAIDVLAVYTPAVVSYLGSKLAVETRIQESILSANTGYGNSGISQRLNLVGMEQVTYNENPAGVSDSNRWYYALDRLTFGQTTGDTTTYLADARAFREQYGADLVFMVTNLPSIYCGLGWVAGEAGDANFGFSVVHANCTGASSYTPQHEMGHNMGACHDWNNASDTIKPHCWDDYSYGYQQPNQFYTVMAYSYGCGTCSRINRWSNPNRIYNNYPTSGLVDGQTVYPNNTLTLNNTAYNVANWRQSKSIITGHFTSPSETMRVRWPHTTLRFEASSTEGAITSVEFRAYYDGSWHVLGTDNDISDGWSFFWNTSAISQQLINVQAVVTDFAANTRDITRDNILLTSALLSAGGFESRGGSGGAATTEEQTPEEAVPQEETAPEPVLTEAPQTAVTPAPVIPEPPPQVWHHKHHQTRRRQLY